LGNSGFAIHLRKISDNDEGKPLAEIFKNSAGMLHLLGIVLHFKDETILVISSALVGGNEHKLEKGFFQIRQDIVKGKALRCNRFR